MPEQFSFTGPAVMTAAAGAGGGGGGGGGGEGVGAGGAPSPLDRHSTHPLAFFLRSESLYPVYRRLVSMLGPADLIMLSRTCKALSGLYRTLLSSDWSIDRALTRARVTSDPKRFRSALNGGNALMCGTFALDFLDRNVSADSRLEIVMGVQGWNRAEERPFVMESNRDGSPRGRLDGNLDGEDGRGFINIHRGDCEAVFRYLTEVEGYQLQEDDQFDYDNSNSVFHRMRYHIRWLVETLINPVTGTQIKLTSPMITGSTFTDKLPESMAELLMEFAHTSGVNFITGDRAISLFPALTYTLRKAFPISRYVASAAFDWDGHAQSLLDRNIDSVKEFFPPTAYSFLHSQQLHNEVFVFRLWYQDERRISGPTSWVLPLDTDGVSPARVPSEVIDAAYYNISIRAGYEGDGTTPDAVEMDALVPQHQHVEILGASISSPCLRYVYCSSLTTPMDILHRDVDRTADAFACSQALKNRAEHAWHAHFDANIAASNALRIGTRDGDFRHRTRCELMREVARLSDAWFRDHEIVQWARDAEAEKRALPRRQEGALPVICVPGITTRGSI